MTDKRTEFALRSLQPGASFSELCAEYGISRKTGYKWKARFEQSGAAGMRDVSRRPHSSPTEIGEEALCRMARLRGRHPAWGPKKIRQLYARSFGDAPSESSFKRIFGKCGWTAKRKRARSSQSGRISSGRVATRCNEVWTVDFKGWWRTGEGERFEPLTVRDERSRFVLESRAMATTATDAVREVFETLFRRHGLPEAIRSDNGVPFAARSAVLGLSRLSAWWVALGIDLERGRPGKPQDNGAHERMHLDISKEVERHAKGSLREQQAALEIWRETFNTQRPHESLGMRTPAEVYEPSERRYEGTPADIEYDKMISRRVSKRGYISVAKQLIPISTALGGWSVGLLASDADHYEVHFANLRIGQIELSSASFLAAASGGEEGGSQSLRTS